MFIVREEPRCFMYGDFSRLNFATALIYGGGLPSNLTAKLFKAEITYQYELLLKKKADLLELGIEEDQITLIKKYLNKNDFSLRQNG